jgi:hypothetical protein
VLAILLPCDRLHNAKWSVETDFHLSPERMQPFIRAFIKDAVVKEEIEVELPYNSYLDAKPGSMAEDYLFLVFDFKML